MATLKEIRKKIKTTKSIQKTTKAMQMIASARFQKAQRQITSSKPYALKIQHLLSDMLKKTSPLEINHPFLIEGSSSKEGLLVVTSEKGLCGAYNTNIMKNAFEYMKSKDITDLEIFVIGKKGRDYFKRNGINIKHEYFDIFKNFSSVKAEIIADEISKTFNDLRLIKFSIMYAEYKSIFYQPIVIKQLLPIVAPMRDETRFSFDYIYEPSGKIIMDKLLNRYLKSEVFKILTEAYTSEVAHRRNSMENANKNSMEIISELSLVMNKLRQQQITTELTEIMGASG
ncbi:MAG: ATP synthase F1 subunit gamma [Elusimicrobiota bacterium]|nr:ATP synthase F1 subunit gamma [Elusimicrobiota bacterium]